LELKFTIVLPVCDIHMDDDDDEYELSLISNINDVVLIDNQIAKLEKEIRLCQRRKYILLINKI